VLLSIQDLKVAFRMGKGVRAEAVKGVSFDIAENTTVALVGESGSGKSVTAMSVLNLLCGPKVGKAKTCCKHLWPNCKSCVAKTLPACFKTR
jgi:ABC-type dipeptide/oligopeptide/nickel transport system ATPase component